MRRVVLLWSLRRALRLLAQEDCHMTPAAEAQRERILTALRDVQWICARLATSERFDVTAEQLEQAFNAYADVGEWNRRHPDAIIVLSPKLALPRGKRD